MYYDTFCVGTGLFVIGASALCIGHGLERYHSMRYRRLHEDLRQKSKDEWHKTMLEFYRDTRLNWVSRLMLPFQTIGMLFLCLGLTMMLVASA